MGKMKGVLLEAAAINKGDMSWEELSELVDLTIYENTTEENKYDHIGDAEVIFDNKVLIDENMSEYALQDIMLLTLMLQAKEILQLQMYLHTVQIV